MAAENDKLPTVPKQYAGRWIAWNRDQTPIIASGGTMEDARHGAKAAGEPPPILAKVPRADVRILGAVQSGLMDVTDLKIYRANGCRHFKPGKRA